MLRALHEGFARHGGRYLANSAVDGIDTGGAGFRLSTRSGPFEAERIVIAAGLATTELARMVGLHAPVRPVHGQLMITERFPRRLEIPTNIVRQVGDGGFQIGYSNEDLAYSTETRPSLMRDIAHNAVRAFPFLADLRVLRTWGALRIMTPDGFPIYAESAAHPGAFVMTCHSGVTLGAVHAYRGASWIAEGALSEQARPFAAERFDVQAA
jgi:glycine/D-amino acid oxidase-like deaminating enzyme